MRMRILNSDDKRLLYWNLLYIGSIITGIILLITNLS